jgi:putative aminopeptidase FrvX
MLLGAGSAAAQGSQGAADAAVLDRLTSWIALVAAPGREALAADRIARAVPGWQRDRIGNLLLRRGAGRPRRVVACGLDEPGYVVSEIRSDGYLRVHGSGTGPRHELWDQFHEGQRVVVLTDRGPVPGVMGVRSTHLWRRRAADDSVTTIEQLWVDVGARSRDEVRRLGIALLDPVMRDWPRWTYADFVAGPHAADRTGCAAVAAAATRTVASGETIFLLAAQSSFGWRGLSAALASLEEVDTLVLASARLVPPDSGSPGPVVRRSIRPPFRPAPGLRLDATVALAVRARYPGTLVESVQADDAVRYLAAVAEAAGARPQPAETLAIPALPIPPAPLGNGARHPSDSLAEAAELLARLTETYAVSGHEEAMRQAIRAALPSWARARTRADSLGNLVLAVGPERDTVVFVAHLDEVGFEVGRIAPDGQVSLVPRGGFYRSLWEGQPALLHLERDTGRAVLRGVFVPRERAERKQPGELVAWFGLDSAALVARGVAPGDAVTGFKRSARVGATRFTARAIDDRAGCTALVLAVRALQPARLTRKVIFAWSVREETGLTGAAALADRYRSSVQRVYAIDTFVSSDAPLESDRFAYAPLGRGVVARALDNSSVTPPAEVDRVAAIARTAGVPLQIGTTNGGNDGSEFVRYGVPDVPLGWPSRYSHSPAELADLTDIVALGRLVAALAQH